MSNQEEQKEPERRFVVVEKKSVMHELHDQPDDPRAGMFGPGMFAVDFFRDALRWIDRRRAARARKRQMRAEDSSKQ
jgi:hypothetical protein